MAHEEIYDFFIEETSLSEKHKEELAVKRGFSKATTEKNKFRSCELSLIKLEGRFKSKFSDDDLIKSGLFIKQSPIFGAQINPMVLENRIIIPYLNGNGSCYHLRPHKLGFSDVPVEIYQEFNFTQFSDRSEIILTEGEFKAAAGVQFGIPTIGIPGIASFSQTHFPRITAFLNKYQVKRIVIIFDNEVKDDPQYTNRYKENPIDRYDTQFYAAYMAYRLTKESFETVIGWLPDGWRVDGKIDIDGAAATGKTREDMLRVMREALPQREFIRSLPKEAAAIVNRKLTQKFHRSAIKKEFGRYVATRQRGKSVTDEIISNFLMKIVATHETAEGHMREIVFINEAGKHSSSFTASAEDMASIRDFTVFCFAKGNFVWRGMQEDLMTIWEDEFLMMDEGRVIVEPDHIGWIEADKMWVFGNVAMTEDGRELRPDKSQTFWIEKKGIKAISMAVDSRQKMVDSGVPCLSMIEFRVEQVLERLSKSIGENEAKQCLGWLSAIVFMEEVFERYGSFPFLFITGKRASGKSTVAEWLMNFFGMENSGKMASETTSVAIQRYLSYYSSLPVFVDEYRNTDQIKYKTGLLRNAYNRQSAGKGTREGWGVREARIRGTLLIAGEETPEDNALLTRCIPVFLYEKQRLENNFHWFMANRAKFSNHTLELIKTKKARLDVFFRIMEEARKYFVSEGRDERTAINYATVAAGYAAAFGDKDIDFARWIGKETERIQAEFDEEQSTVVFWEYMIAMKTKGVMDDKYWGAGTHNGSPAYFLYFEGAYNEFSQEFRKTRGALPFKKSAVRAYMKEEPGFLELRHHHALKGQVKSCMVFDRHNAPDHLKHLIESVDVLI